jgi:hypothetical protein
MASDIQFPAVRPGAGTLTAELIDQRGAPAGVLDARQHFVIKLRWSVSRSLAAMIGGEWEIRIFADAIGPGPAMPLTIPLTVPADGSPSYYLPVLVPGGTLPSLDPGRPSCGASGAYKIIVLLGHRNHGAYTDVSAVVELSVARIC